MGDEHILMMFFGGVGHVLRNSGLDFGDDLEYDLDAWFLAPYHYPDP